MGSSSLLLYCTKLMQSVSPLLLLFLVCSNICYSNAQTTNPAFETTTYPTVATLFPPQDCPNLSPCTCYKSFDNTINVECDEAPMEEIKIVFSRISPPIEIDYLTLHIRPPPGDSIPADLLGQSQVRGELEIIGQYDLPPLLRVDPNAFRSSGDSLQSISFSRLDSRLLDFGFLSGFRNLSELSISAVTDLYKSLPTLPALPALNSLNFDNEPSLNTALASGDLVLQCDGLNSVSISNCDMDDFGLAQFLDWILPSSSKTLGRIQIYGILLKSVPLQMASFQALKYVALDGNQQSLAIPTNAIYFIGEDTGDNNTAPYLGLSRVNFVAPGAFQGDYSFTKVDLSYNGLTRFEEDAFKSMLQDMTFGTGYLDVEHRYDTWFDCYTDPCHLAWLLRDNRDLLGSLTNARCYEMGNPNEIPFADLPLSLFENCPLSMKHQLENAIFKLKRQYRDTVSETKEMFNINE